jgi:hypothetical protein
MICEGFNLYEKQLSVKQSSGDAPAFRTSGQRGLRLARDAAIPLAHGTGRDQL